MSGSGGRTVRPCGPAGVCVSSALALPVLVPVLLSLPLPGWAPTQDPPASRSPGAREDRDLQALLDAAREEAGAPALGCAVLLPGDEVQIAVNGARLAGEASPVTAEDPWHWGSVTKSITATLAARLVESEVVDWDDTVGKWLGDTVKGMNPAYESATIRQLLAHRSGQPANIPMARFREFGQSPEDPIADRLAWVEIALSQEPLGAPGESFAYSNNGYIIVGAMLEAATGTSWEALVRREVFIPLKLSGAGFGAPAGEAPRGHTRGADGTDAPVPPDSDNPGALGPAGRVHMPLGDMILYLSAHAREEPEYLGSESWTVLHTPAPGGRYALGWVRNAEETCWHNGSNTMWYAEVAFSLDTGTVAAVVANDGDMGAVRPVLSRLISDLMGSGPGNSKSSR